MASFNFVNIILVLSTYYWIITEIKHSTVKASVNFNVVQTLIYNFVTGITYGGKWQECSKHKPAISCSHSSSKTAQIATWVPIGSLAVNLLARTLRREKIFSNACLSFDPKYIYWFYRLELFVCHPFSDASFLIKPETSLRTKLLKRLVNFDDRGFGTA